MRETLQSGLSSLGLSLSEEQLDRFCRYGTLLLEKNQVMNLTAIREPEKVATLHFLDSLTLLRAADFRDKAVIDVGCGAGFPGVPLKLAEPSLHLTLLDSLQKRVAWLQNELLPALGTEAVCVAGRAEEYAAAHRERYDIAVSRAVARLNVLLELCLPLVRVGGCFLAMKGQGAEEELREAEKALRVLGGKVASVESFPIEDAVHKVIRIEKVAPTPRQYPRPYAKIKKQPL